MNTGDITDSFESRLDVLEEMVKEISSRMEVSDAKRAELDLVVKAFANVLLHKQYSKEDLKIIKDFRLKVKSKVKK